MNKRLFTILAVVAVLLCIGFAWLLVRQEASAAPLSNPDVPPLIGYQGRLTDAANNPLSGDYDMRFCLYAVPTGGSSLWCEIHAAVNDTAIPVDYGVFSVMLGSVTPIPESVFDEAELYLGVKVEGDAEMTPRRRVVSVGYAYRAEAAVDADTVDGMHADDFASASHTHPEIEGVPSGLIALFDGGGCPAGWTRVAQLDGKFLVGGSSYNPAAGGSNTHAHSAGSYAAPSHVHAMPSVDCMGWNAPPGGPGVCCEQNAVRGASFVGSVTQNAGGGAITGTSSSADSRPEFATVLLCKKD
jgi:hypothetical protein